MEQGPRRPYLRSVDLWDLNLFSQPFAYLPMFNNLLFLNSSHVISMVTSCSLLYPFTSRSGGVSNKQTFNVPPFSTRIFKNEKFVTKELNWMMVVLVSVND